MTNEPEAELDKQFKVGQDLLEWIKSAPAKKDLEAMAMTLTVMANSSANIDTDGKDFEAVANWAGLLFENLTILQMLYAGVVCAKADSEGRMEIRESPLGEQLRKKTDSAEPEKESDD